MNNGKFIVIEGLEGAGKTTAMQTLKNSLDHQHIEFITTREPGGTCVGEAVRQMIKSQHATEPLDARAELLLIYAARIQLVECVIKPALARGCWVLSDRFELSTWAYQGGGRQLDLTTINEISKFSLQGFKPDLTIFLDISPQQGLKRAKMRSKADRIEQESLSFFESIYDAYHHQLTKITNVVQIDASKPLLEVQQKIAMAIQAYIEHAYEQIS